MNQTFCFLPNGNGTFFLHQMFLTWEVLYSIASLWHFEQDYATINNMRLRLQHNTRIGSIDLYHTYLSECMLSILKSYKITPKCVEMYSWSSYCIGTALRSGRIMISWENKLWPWENIVFGTQSQEYMSTDTLSWVQRHIRSQAIIVN